LEPNQLIQILKDIWQNRIKADYKSGLIHKERQLQAYFFKYISEELDEENKIWVEPDITINGLKYIPDLVVSDSDQVSIVAVLELKYVPQGFPKYENDLKKIESMSETNEHFFLDINHNTGIYDINKKYRISQDCIFCFCVIGKHDAAAVQRLAYSPTINKGNFFHFHGSIGKGDPIFNIYPD
jgi:hypothetical protein